MKAENLTIDEQFLLSALYYAKRPLSNSSIYFYANSFFSKKTLKDEDLIKGLVDKGYLNQVINKGYDPNSKSCHNANVHNYTLVKTIKPLKPYRALPNNY